MDSSVQISLEALEAAREAAEAFSPPEESIKEVGAPLPPSFQSFPYIERLLGEDKQMHQACINQGLIGVGRHFTEDILPAVKEGSEASFPVLITGETGTGKEIIAKCIHALGPRMGKQFQTLNCGGLPTELVESELFGHEKGAFTGAASRKRGLVEVADGGTLFLDEIGDMPMPVQVKLLRFLNDGSFMPVGGTKEKEVDVRIITATNKDPKELVDRGEFRSDLYYRINTMELYLWPLYLRPEDFPLLIYHFVQKFNKDNANPIRTLHRRALQEALLYRWPGNIRECEHKIVRACHAARLRSGSGDSLESLGIPVRLPRKTSEMNFLHKKIEVEGLPAFPIRSFLEAMDKFLEPVERKQWTIGMRSVQLWQEKEGDGEQQQDPIELLLDLPFHEVKKRYFTQLVEQCGSISQAAKKSGVSRSQVGRAVGYMLKKSK